MSQSDLQRVKEALIRAGVEIYRTVSSDGELQIAERVRLHIMDSGVRLRAESALRVCFTARSQRSDFPNVEADTLFDQVRDAVGAEAIARGYEESSARTIEVKDPVDDARILDTWHEVTYERVVEGEEDAIAEVQWALGVEKYITSSRTSA